MFVWSKEIQAKKEKDSFLAHKDQARFSSVKRQTYVRMNELAKLSDTLRQKLDVQQQFLLVELAGDAKILSKHGFVNLGKQRPVNLR